MKLLILTYHYFHQDKPFGIKPEDFCYSVPVKSLKIRCQQFLDWSGDIIRPDQLNDGPFWDADGNGIIVTIDDGHQSTGEAAEIFLEYGIRPILFVIPDRVEQNHYLDWNQLRNLANKGCSIQSHTMSHLKLTGLSQSDLLFQLDQSKKVIEEKIGRTANMLAVPMGRINHEVSQMAVACGYKTIMTSFTGINSSADDLTFIKRFQVKQDNMELPPERYFSRFSGVRVGGMAKSFIKKMMTAILSVTGKKPD